MQAFPKDSRNMALGGAGPNKSKMDLNQFHGRGAEGYTDFATGSKGGSGGGGRGGAAAAAASVPTSGSPVAPTVSFDPSAKLEMIHGDESMGLGTSTFLEGAPASQTAIQRRQSESETQMEQNGGLQRKKSLAQKIRRMNTRGGGGGGAAGQRNRTTSSDRDPADEEGVSRSAAGGSPRRPSSSRRPASRYPFFQQDYDDAYEKKGARIQQAQADDTRDEDMATAAAASAPRRTRSTSSPNPGIERRVTTGDIGDGDGDTAEADDSAKQSGGNGIGGGLMNRVKSLRRPRTERRPSTKNTSD